MTTYHLVNKKDEQVCRIIVNDRGSFRYMGKGSFGAGCGHGSIDDAIESILEGFSARKRNSVRLVKSE